MGTVIVNTIRNLPGAFFFTAAFFYKSLSQSSLCQSRKKANQCFYFTRGCEACLEQEADIILDYPSMKEVDMISDYPSGRRYSIQRFGSHLEVI
jgi:hypothetical protein